VSQPAFAIHAELAKGAPAARGVSREDFVADLYARRGVYPADPEHRAIEDRARASVRRRRHPGR
jgi:hypothetical protein